MKAETRNSAIQVIENYLTYLALANVPKRRFDKSLLFTPDFCDTEVHPDSLKIWLGATAADVGFSWTVKMIGHAGLNTNGCLFVMYDDRTVARSEIAQFRARIPNGDLNFYECYSRHGEYSVMPDGRTITDDVYLGHRGKRCTVFDPKAKVMKGVDGTDGIFCKRSDAAIERTLRVELGLAFMLPAYWQAHVAITDDTPHVSMVTDPTGVKELWKFRDIPEGKCRRDALLHWVNAHWRQNRHDPDVEGYVRSHLRGKRSLKCAGLSVEVEESVDDRKRLMQIVTERKYMMIHKRDRRLRPR